MAKERRIVWDTVAKSNYRKYLSHIRSESYQNAISVNHDILSILNKLKDYPESHAPDKYKVDNDGEYRAFEKHNLRVSYRVVDDTIRIIRTRGVKQIPKKY